MFSIGKKVSHQFYGTGIVARKTEYWVYVKFEDGIMRSCDERYLSYLTKINWKEEGF